MSKNASILKRLLKVANEFDRNGLTKEADQLDGIIRSLAEDESFQNEESEDTTEGEQSSPVAEALEEAAQSGYLAKVLDQRNPSSPNKAGSYFLEDQDLQSLKAANWEPYSHPAIGGPAQGFRAPIPGVVGVVKLSDLPQDMMVMATDPKETHGTEGGGFSIEAKLDNDSLPTSEYTTALLGPARDSDKLTLWTVFPGDPTGASIVGTHAQSPLKPKDPGSFKVWEEIPVRDALAQGFEYGKVVSNYSPRPAK